MLAPRNTKSQPYLTFLLRNQLLYSIFRPLAAGVLVAVGQHDHAHFAGAILLGQGRKTAADLRDEPADRVEQCGRSPRFEGQRRHPVDGRVLVHRLILVVELGKRAQRRARLLEFLGDERVESAASVVGDRLHGTAAVEQGGDEHQVGIGHADSLNTNGIEATLAVSTDNQCRSCVPAAAAEEEAGRDQQQRRRVGPPDRDRECLGFKLGDPRCGENRPIPIMASDTAKHTAPSAVHGVGSRASSAAQPSRPARRCTASPESPSPPRSASARTTPAARRRPRS